MKGVTVVDHPLVQHKLTLIRETDRPTKSFRELARERGILLCYEITRDLPLDWVEIETPMTKMKAPVIAGKKLVFAPILRGDSPWSTACSISCRRPASPISGSIATPTPRLPSNIT